MDAETEKLLAECRARKAERAQNRTLKKRAKSAKPYRQRSQNGEHELPEYRVWRNMQRRCYDPKDPWYHRYGGRGIEVCPEWRESFSRFLADVGQRPSDRHQIDRIDNEGHYCPANCKWSTATEQARNRHTSIIIELSGEEKCAKEWCRELGVKYQALRSRIRRGADPKRALLDLSTT